MTQGFDPKRYAELVAENPRKALLDLCRLQDSITHLNESPSQHKLHFEQEKARRSAMIDVLASALGARA